MKRRSFIRKFSSGVGSLALLPGLDHRIPERLNTLGEDLRGLGNPDDLWKRVRAEFQLNPGVLHFNSGTLGATPRVVLDAISGYLYKMEGNPAVDMYGWGGAQMEEVRAKLAGFIGADLAEVAFTRNTTEGMYAIADGLNLKAGDQVLTTNHEHGGGMVCWQNLRQKLGIEIVYVKMPRQVESKQQLVDLISEKVTPRTKVCSLSHIDTITGVRMPFAEISSITRDKGIILVGDGAQAPGQIAVNVSSLGVDAYAFSSHKWLLGPKGSGVLFIRKEVQDRIKPALLYSGYSSYSASSGTRNAAHILGQRIALEFHENIGSKKIEDRCRELNTRLRGHLSTIPELSILTPERPDLSCGIVTCTVNKGKNGEIIGRLRDEHSIILKAAQGTFAYCTEEGLERENYNAIRFSTHIFNDENDIDLISDRLKGVFQS